MQLERINLRTCVTKTTKHELSVKQPSPTPGCDSQPALIISTVMSRIASNQRHTDFSKRLNVFPYSSELSVNNYVLAFSWGFTTVITFSFSSVKGWFYKGFFLGSQPNEKLKKERRKKYKAISGSEPLPPFRSLLQ